MSYRNPDQELEPHLEKILAGIEGFSEAVRARIKSREWTNDHIQEISALREELQRLEIRLTTLKAETW